MLKYASKFFLEKILPSIVATVAGAYIVNHYVVANKAADAPLAAALSAADPKKDITHIPEAGVRAKGISEKAIEKASVEKVQVEKALEKAAEKPAETASVPAEAKKHRPTLREKAVAKLTPAAAPVAAPAAAITAPAETASIPDEHRDANDLARAAIERLRGSNETSARPQDARPPEASRPQIQEAHRVAAPPLVQPLPPAIMISTPAAEAFNPDPKPSYARIVNPRRPTPPADIPGASSRPLDLEASAAVPPREHTTVADDMLSAAKSVFQAVLPK